MSFIKLFTKIFTPPLYKNSKEHLNFFFFFFYNTLLFMDFLCATYFHRTSIHMLLSCYG